MTLAADLGLGRRELVAFVGGGGKSTLMFSLARELAGAGRRALMTTTTKMGADQGAAADAAGLPLLITRRDASKIVGPPREEIDRVFASGEWEYVLVEADGSRGRSLKVPAGHEPVIPATSTLVVIVMGVDAIGRTLAEVAHRPEDAASLLGVAVDTIVTPEHCARVLRHRDGGLRGVPEPARVVVALTKSGRREQAAHIARLLADAPGIDDVVRVPPQTMGLWP